LAERYDDCGHAGTNTDRPALQRLLAKVKNGEVSYVVVDSVDRLSRSARDLAQIIRTLNKHDAAIVFVNGGER
jgi:DNA invertase Pin-like site-specific DNA recombinase